MTDVQQSLFDEQTQIEKRERETRLHKTAFRVAFDFLQSHWPPENTEEYWLKACDDIRYASYDNTTNELCQELLSAVLVYMSNSSKQQ